MSHFLQVKTALKVQATLTQALTAMGFEVEAVTLTPGLSARALQRLAMTYTNTFHKQQKAHVIARHEQLRAKATAIGFLWDSVEQAYTLQCDPYEICSSDYGRQFGHVVGDEYGKPLVQTPYDAMDDSGILTVLKQQLQIEYDRALVYSTYNVLSESYVGTEVCFTATPKATQVSLGATVQRV